MKEEFDFACEFGEVNIETGAYGYAT